MPIMKKAGHGHIVKSGHIGKTGSKLKASGPLSSSGKIGSSASKVGSTGSKPMSSGKLGSGTKASSFSSTPKSYASPLYNAKSGKSSSFGIIWLPMKKRNKYKDVSYNSHKNERTKDRGPSMYGFMSVDSSNHTPFMDHKKEETSLLVPENKASTSVAIIGTGAVAASDLPTDKTTSTEEKQDLIKPEKDVTGDGDKIKDDYLENNDKVVSNAPDSQTMDKPEDIVDSVFLRSPSPHKRRSTTPAPEEEEDCGIKCLYYTLQCCDCVLM